MQRRKKLQSPSTLAGNVDAGEASSNTSTSNHSSTPPPPVPSTSALLTNSRSNKQTRRTPMKRDRVQASLDDLGEESDEAGPSALAALTTSLEQANISSTSFTMELPENLSAMVSEWNLPQPLRNYFHTKRINELQTWHLECLREFMLPKEDFPNLICIGDNASYPGQNTILDITLFTHLLGIKKECSPEETKNFSQQSTQPQQSQSKKVLIIEPSIVAVRRRLHELGGVLADLNLRIESLVVCGNVTDRLDRCDVIVCTEQSALMLIERYVFVFVLIIQFS